MPEHYRRTTAGQDRPWHWPQQQDAIRKNGNLNHGLASNPWHVNGVRVLFILHSALRIPHWPVYRPSMILRR
jgi:hypothetical protein